MRKQTSSFNKKITFTLFIIFPGFFFAQQPSFRHYTVNDGLPSSEVYRVLQDSKGFMWFATDRGVTRYDGYRFKNYGLKDGLPDNTIFHLFEDYKNRIWFISYSNKLSYYENEKIVQYKYNDVLLKNIKNQVTVTDFYVDEKDNVYYGLNFEGAYKMSVDGRCAKMHKNETGVFITRIAKQKLFDYSFQSSDALSDTLKKFMINNYSLFLKKYFNGIQITGEKNVSLPFPHSTFAGTTPLSTISESDSSFFLSYNNAIYFVKNNRIHDSIYLHSSIIWLYRDNQNIIWAGLLNGGVVTFFEKSLHGRCRILFEKKSVSCIKQDNEGGYWVTTLNDGVYYLPSTNISLYDRGSGFPSDNISAVMGDKHDNIWISVKPKEFYFINTYKNTVEKVRSKYNLHTYVTDIAYDEFQDEMYFATTNPFKINTITQNVTFVDNVNKGKWSTPLSYAISKGGIIWKGSYSGLAWKTKEEKGFEHDYITNLRVDALAINSKEEVFLGNMKGLWKCEPEKIKFLGDSNEILQTRITSLKSMDNGRIAIGTKGRGVVVYDNGKVENITEKNGLVSDIVTHIFYFKGIIWTGTNKGVSKINTATKPYSIESITVAEGISSNEINQLYANDSMLYLATNNGLNVINHKRYFQSSYAIPVYINSIKINNNDTLLTSQYDLNYDQNSIDIDFIGLSYRTPGKINYRYQLLGLDTIWHYVSSTQLRFPSLLPGNYQLTIQASVSPNIWNSSFKTIVFNIAPALTDRWWFKLLVLVLVVAIVTSGFIIRIKQIRTRNKLREEMNSYQMQALSAQMNPHFIFNSLNSIQNYILQNDKKESNKYLTKFARLMRMVFDNSQKITISLQEEIDALTNYIDLEVLRFKERFTYQIEIDEGVDASACKVPPLIIQPFIENAIWHGFMHKQGPGFLHISFTAENNYVVCTVSDNGVGREKAAEITKASRPGHKSGGLSVTEKRLEIINKFNNEKTAVEVVDLKDENGLALGTKIILKLPKSTK